MKRLLFACMVVLLFCTACHEHTPVADVAVDATCTAVGLTAGEHCSDCGEILVAQTEIAKLPHTPVADPVAEVPAVELAEGDTDFPLDSLTLEALLAKNYNVLKFLKATDGDRIPHTRGAPDYSYVLNPDETLYEGKIKAFGKTCDVYVSANARFISHVAILADAGYLTKDDMPFTDKAKDKQVKNTVAIVNSMFDALGNTGKMTYQQAVMGEGWKTFDGHIDDLPQMIRAEYEGDGFIVHFDGNFKIRGANRMFTVSVAYTQYGTFAAKHGHEVLLSVS